ncbi:hypothetical protein [Streptomyces sp. NPDC004134]|uniref:hypothetical protein n=1 Tax=Streptomyces sp. NPDC004134 TaxID=3364691 RepID=UPI0036A7EB93
MRATLISALVAALALVFTGASTYYGALVARDQLEQSRNDAKAKEKSQASKVSYWLTREGGKSRWVISNRSLDPVYSVIFSPTHSKSIGFQSLEPCTKVTFPSRALSKNDEMGNSDFRGIIFTDTVGELWIRTFTQVKKANEPEPGEVADGEAEVRYFVGLDTIRDEGNQDFIIPRTPLKQCG